MTAAVDSALPSAILVDDLGEGTVNTVQNEDGISAGRSLSVWKTLHL
jgi:hypothetical protein